MMKIDDSGRGVVKFLKYENEKFVYEVEIEGTISSYRLEQLPLAPQKTTSRFQSVNETDVDQFIHDQEN